MRPQVSYAIGVAEPLSIHVDTYGTAKEGVNDKQILAAVKKVFDFRPGGWSSVLAVADCQGHEAWHTMSSFPTFY